jgi:hypothetical protein
VGGVWSEKGSSGIGLQNISPFININISVCCSSSQITTAQSLFFEQSVYHHPVAFNDIYATH